jgi:uncharacterized protein YbjT (DUF2867 family)
MLKTIFKVLLGLVLVVVALVGYLLFDLRAKVPAATYALAPPLAVSADPRPVLIFGASGATGIELVRLLRARGDAVTAAVRASSDRTELESLGVEFVVADALDAAAVRAAVASDDFRAVVSSLYCANCQPSVDDVGNINVAEGARAAGVPRMLLISTIGAGDSYPSANLISRYILRDILPLKTAAEDHLRASGQPYTILRPGGLMPGKATGRGYISEDRTAFGFLTRGDLARIIVAVLDDPATLNKVFAVADPGVPFPWDIEE